MRNKSTVQKTTMPCWILMHIVIGLGLWALYCVKKTVQNCIKLNQHWNWNQTQFDLTVSSGIWWFFRKFIQFIYRQNLSLVRKTTVTCGNLPNIFHTNKGFGLYIVQRRLSKLVQNWITIEIRQMLLFILNSWLKKVVIFSEIYWIYIQKVQIAGREKTDNFTLTSGDYFLR
jgi:hypothetical protein